MNALWLDWLILGIMLAIIVIGVVKSRRYMTSVADFLSENWTTGRYLESVSGGIAALGVIPISVAIFFFIFSLFFKQSQLILLFFAITASIFTAGGGPVIGYGTVINGTDDIIEA